MEASEVQVAMLVNPPSLDDELADEVVTVLDVDSVLRKVARADSKMARAARSSGTSARSRFIFCVHAMPSTLQKLMSP